MYNIEFLYNNLRFNDYMLKCNSCELEFSGMELKTDIIFDQFCPRCKSFDIQVLNKSNPIYKSIIAWFVLLLFLSTIMFPILL